MTTYNIEVDLNNMKGTIDGVDFDLGTEKYQGDTIYKVLEGGKKLSLKESKFSRGQRMAIARIAKQSAAQSEIPLTDSEMPNTKAEVDSAPDSMDGIIRV